MAVMAVMNVQDGSLHMSFILKGSQILVLQLKGWFKSTTSIQEYRNEIQNSYKTCRKIKNQPSDSTSCSDNALCLLVLVVGKIY
jgi:hypothetical protein